MYISPESSVSIPANQCIFGYTEFWPHQFIEILSGASRIVSLINFMFESGSASVEYAFRCSISLKRGGTSAFLEEQAEKVKTIIITRSLAILVYINRKGQILSF